MLSPGAWPANKFDLISTHDRAAMAVFLSFWGVNS
jgi:hypothetical protein